MCWGQAAKVEPEPEPEPKSESELEPEPEPQPQPEPEPAEPAGDSYLALVAAVMPSLRQPRANALHAAQRRLAFALGLRYGLPGGATDLDVIAAVCEQVVPDKENSVEQWCCRQDPPFRHFAVGPSDKLADQAEQILADLARQFVVYLNPRGLPPTRENGADLDARHPVHGTTALMVAARDGQVECVRALLAGGADRTLRGTGGIREGQTALEIAEEKKKKASWESDQEFATKQKRCAEVAALLRG